MPDIDPTVSVAIDPPPFWGTSIYNPEVFDKVAFCMRQSMQELGITNPTTFGTDPYRPNVYIGVFLDPLGLDGDDTHKRLTIWSMQTGMPAAGSPGNAPAPSAGTNEGIPPFAPEGA